MEQRGQPPMQGGQPATQHPGQPQQGQPVQQPPANPGRVGTRGQRGSGDPSQQVSGIPGQQAARSQPPTSGPQQANPAPARQPRGVGRGQPGAGGTPLRPVSIEDVARTEVVTAGPDATVDSLVADMAEQNVGSVVIVEDGRAVGVVTDRTIALDSTSDVTELTAEELLGDELVTVPEDADVFDVLRRMSDAGVRRLPIVDEDGNLVGIVTLDDVLLFLEEHLHTVAETVREQLPDV